MENTTNQNIIEAASIKLPAWGSAFTYQCRLKRNVFPICRTLSVLKAIIFAFS